MFQGHSKAVAQAATTWTALTMLKRLFEATWNALPVLALLFFRHRNTLGPLHQQNLQCAANFAMALSSNHIALGRARASA